MTAYVVHSRGRVQVAVQPTKDGDAFLAWGKFGTIKGPDAVREPGLVFFNFAPTAELAVEKTFTEIFPVLDVSR